MPTDHGEVTLDGVRVGDDAVLGEVDRGLDCAQLFVHENRIRQAASSLGAAQFCIDRSIAYARERVIFGKPLADYQGIQWQLVELQTEAELVRSLLYRTAWEMDSAAAGPPPSAKIERLGQGVDGQLPRQPPGLRRRRPGHPGPRRARLHPPLPFEYIYRHHRRYRITEGSDELQLRRIAGRLFGFTRGPAPGCTATGGRECVSVAAIELQRAVSIGGVVSAPVPGSGTAARAVALGQDRHRRAELVIARAQGTSPARAARPSVPRPRADTRPAALAARHGAPRPPGWRRRVPHPLLHRVRERHQPRQVMARVAERPDLPVDDRRQPRRRRTACCPAGSRRGGSPAGRPPPAPAPPAPRRSALLAAQILARGSVQLPPSAELLRRATGPARRPAPPPRGSIACSRGSIRAAARARRATTAGRRWSPARCPTWAHMPRPRRTP